MELQTSESEPEKVLPYDLFTAVITTMYQSPSNACFSLSSPAHRATWSGRSPRCGWWWRRSIFYELPPVQSSFRHYHHHQNAIFKEHTLDESADIRWLPYFYTRKKFDWCEKMFVPLLRHRGAKVSPHMYYSAVLLFFSAMSALLCCMRVGWRKKLF